MLPNYCPAQERLVKILVTSPAIENDAYQPFADVMAGSIIRELKRAGGLVVIPREKSEEFMLEKSGKNYVKTRDEALKAGEELKADIVIFSTIEKTFDTFKYGIIFLEIKTDTIQRVMSGSFNNSDSASEISRMMKKNVDSIIKYIPLPSELDDPGAVIRDNTIDPDKPPTSYIISNIPPMGQYGFIELIFNLYRVFPGQEEYEKFERGTKVMRFSFRDSELDEELTQRLNMYYIYGDFAIRHNMQAYLIKNCSTKAMNILLANNVPIFYQNDLLYSYTDLLPDGYCIFRTISGMAFDTTEMIRRERTFVLIILPRPGKRGGISKEYLESAIGRYKDELGETPELVELTEGLLDIK